MRWGTFSFSFTLGLRDRIRFLQLSLRDGGDRRYTRGSAYRIEGPVFLQCYAAGIRRSSAIDAGDGRQEVPCPTGGDHGGCGVHSPLGSDFPTLIACNRSISRTDGACSGHLSSRMPPTKRGNRKASPKPSVASAQVCTGDRVI